MLTPSLLLSPGGSRDISASVPVSTVGTVNIVPGQYGDAWHGESGGHLTVSTWQHVIPAKGTILMRVTTDESWAVTAGAFDANATTPRLQAYVSSVSSMFNQWIGTTSRPTGVTLPADAFLTIGARWGPGGNSVFAGSQFGTVWQDAPPDTVDAYMMIGRASISTESFPGAIESVLVYQDELPNNDILRLGGMDEAWTWDGVIAALTPSPRTIHPVLKIGSSHIGPLRVGERT